MRKIQEPAFIWRFHTVAYLHRCVCYHKACCRITIAYVADVADVYEYQKRHSRLRFFLRAILVLSSYRVKATLITRLK